MRQAGIPFSTRNMFHHPKREFQPAYENRQSRHLRERSLKGKEDRRDRCDCAYVLFLRDAAPQIVQRFAQNARVGVTASVRKLPIPARLPKSRNTAACSNKRQPR